MAIQWQWGSNNSDGWHSGSGNGWRDSNNGNGRCDGDSNRRRSRDVTVPRHCDSAMEQCIGVIFMVHIGGSSSERHVIEGGKMREGERREWNGKGG